MPTNPHKSPRKSSKVRKMDSLFLHALRLRGIARELQNISEELLRMRDPQPNQFTKGKNAQKGS